MASPALLDPRRLTCIPPHPFYPLWLPGVDPSKEPNRKKKQRNGICFILIVEYSSLKYAQNATRYPIICFFWINGFRVAPLYCTCLNRLGCESFQSDEIFLPNWTRHTSYQIPRWLCNHATSYGNNLRAFERLESLDYMSWHTMFH